MVMFHSYVSLPEGNWYNSPNFIPTGKTEDGDFMEIWKILKIPSSSVTWLEPGLWVLKDLIEATLDRTCLGSV